MRCSIPRTLLDRLLAEAAASPSAEVCGLLFGAGDRIEDAAAAANVAIDPSHRFEIDPVTLFAAIRAERAGGPAMIGHYHSHPSGRAVPSAHDAAQALDPGNLWLLIAAGEARLWIARADGAIEQTFDEIALTVR